MKIVIASFLVLMGLNAFGQAKKDLQVTTCSANKDTLFILEPHAASTILSIWKQTYNYTEHTSTGSNGETVQYWQTAPTNKPSVIVVMNTTNTAEKTCSVTHKVIINQGDTIQSWHWTPAAANKTSIASSKSKSSEKDKTTGVGLKQ